MYLEIPSRALGWVPPGEMVVGINRRQVVEDVMVGGLGNTVTGTRLPKDDNFMV